MKTLRVSLSLLFLVWSLPMETMAGPVGKVDGKILVDRTVSGRKLKKKAVTNKELASGAVRTGKLANGAVTNSKLDNGAVTASKLNANLLADPNVVWVSTDGSASGDGTMKSPYGSLYDAVVPANNGKTIVVMPGTYNFTNEILLDATISNMTIMGLSGNPEDTLLNSIDTTERIFNVNGASNITIMNFSFASTRNSGYGGAVYLTSGNTVRNCRFNNCSAVRGGGVFASGASALVDSCEFTGCSSSDFGGGVYAQTNATVRDCIFNNCSSDNGGGVGTWEAIVMDCQFTDCTAAGLAGYGGGVYTNTSSSVSDCQFVDCTGKYGGGAYVFNSSSITRSEFINCNATSSGGGIRAFNSATIRFCEVPRGAGNINQVALLSGAAIWASIWDDAGAASDFVDYSAVGN